jgi:hypothetical protein
LICENISTDSILLANQPAFREAFATLWALRRTTKVSPRDAPWRQPTHTNSYVPET